MKIKIPSHRPIHSYSDTAPFIGIPGDGPVEVSEVAAGGPSGAILGEDGTYILMEDGTYILQD
jgi:hypothetical protein